jgi:multicomponent Na+:H+ antiporter subunit D
MPVSAALDAATAGGFLLVVAIIVPLGGALLAFAAGGRTLEWIALAILPLGLAVAAAIALGVRSANGPLVYLLGGWSPPLGVALRADGLSAVMIAITAVVICAIGFFACADYRTPEGPGKGRAPFAFWILMLGVWGALNTAFLAGDLFTLYVALELLTFSAVPLVCLDGRAETLQAALRYLLFALVGSVLYLVGTVLLYGACGTIDIMILSKRAYAEPTTLVAAALMTVGLLAKTALFPLHLWLPPAHAGAPPAGSAILSALVVKGSFFTLVRLWFDAMPSVPGYAAAQLIAALGAAAILFGSVVALRQERLKLLIAYSTLAQIGTLFVMFPLAFAVTSAQFERGTALSGGLLQAISHATAKAAMFLSAGSIYAALGHDRIAMLGGVGRALPMGLGAFAIGGVALIGVPPAGASLAKELLLRAALETEQWWWAVVIEMSGVLTSAYVVLVLVHALAPARGGVVLRAAGPRYQEIVALALALISLLLGLIAWDAYIPMPHDAFPRLLSLMTLAKTLWTVLAGTALAILLGQWKHRPHASMNGLATIVAPTRRGALALGGRLERIDAILRQWPVAGLSLLMLGLALGMAMVAGR